MQQKKIVSSIPKNNKLSANATYHSSINLSVEPKSHLLQENSQDESKLYKIAMAINQV